MALVWSLATIACAFAAEATRQLLGARSIVGLGEAAYGTVGRGAARYACSRRACAARCSARSSPPASWDRCSASCWAASSPSAGAGRRDSAPSVYPVLLLAFCSCRRPRLQDRCAANASSEAQSLDVDGGSARSCPRCCGRAPHSSRASVPGFNSLMVSTTWAWMPSYFNRFYGLAPDQAGAQDGARRPGGRHRRRRLERRGRSPERAFPACPPSRSGDRRRADRRVHVRRVRRAAARHAAIRVDRRRRDDDDGEHRTRSCAVVVDVVHPAVRATAASVLSLDAKPVRPRRQVRCSPASCPTPTACRSRWRSSRCSACSPPRCSCSLRAPTCPTFSDADGRGRPDDQRAGRPSPPE